MSEDKDKLRKAFDELMTQAQPAGSLSLTINWDNQKWKKPRWAKRFEGDEYGRLVIERRWWTYFTWPVEKLVDRWFLCIAVALVAVLFSFVAAADSQPTAVLLYSKGRLALTRKQAIRAFDDALAVIHRDTGITIRVTRRKRVKVPRLTTDIPYHGLVHYRETFLRQGGTDITFLIAPPVKDPQQPRVPWLAGVARVCAARERWGYAAVHAVKRTKEYASTGFASAYIAHELGHILGAGHVWDGSIMNPARIDHLRRDGSGVVFSAESVEQVYRCQDRW